MMNNLSVNHLLGIKYLKKETQRINYKNSIARLAKNEPKENTPDVVGVMNAWVKEGIPQASVLAGYFTLINPEDEAVFLVGVESSAFKEVEIHEMSMEDGLMKMARLDSLEVPSNGMAKLERGGKHLMLKKPVKEMEAGDTVDLVLKFKSGKKQRLMVKVKKP